MRQVQYNRMGNIIKMKRLVQVISRPFTEIFHHITPSVVTPLLYISPSEHRMSFTNTYF